MSDLSPETKLFNETLSMPVQLPAPVGLCGMYARRGEVQAAAAADAKGIPFTLSTVSLCPIEEVPDHQASDVVPAVCLARSRFYA